MGAESQLTRVLFPIASIPMNLPANSCGAGVQSPFAGFNACGQLLELLSCEIPFEIITTHPVPLPIQGPYEALDFDHGLAEYAQTIP